MKLKDLPFSVFSSLCRLLDSTEPAGQNWRELLSHFPGTVYMPSDVAAFARESTRPDGSPAQAVLQDFIVRGLSVDHLFLMLCDMGHVEGMKTIQQYASPSLHHLLELRLSHTTSGSDRTPQPDPEGDRTSTLKQDTESEATAGPVEEESPSVTALHRLHSTIRESVTIKSLIPFLNEENLLTVDDLAILSLSSTTEFEKIDYLVSLLPHKGDFWDKFIRSLRHPDSLLETAHGEVADKLEEEKQKIEADRQRWPLWQQFEQSRQWQVQSGQVQSGTDVSHIVPRPQLVPSLPERAESQPPPSPLAWHRQTCGSQEAANASRLLSLQSRPKIIPPSRPGAGIRTEEDSATAVSEVKFEGNVLKIISKEIADSPEFLVDPVEIILCDDSGGIYHNPLHGITLRIPDGAIPAGMNLEISIGVLLHGNFEFPEDLSPVSAIVWLCTPQPEFTFSKPVEVIVPHFMECRSSEDAADLQMQFMKASHKSSSTAVLNFNLVDGMQEFTTVAHKGLLRTRHLCYLCIGKSIARRHLQRRELCISCVEPTPEIAITSTIFFYITYFIETCIQDLESKLPEGYRITEQRLFRFNSESAAVSADFECSEILTLTLQPGKISRDKVDFWKLYRSGKLKLMQDRELYPPRIKLKIAEAPPTAEVIKVTFRGTRESEEEMMIALTIPSAIEERSPRKHKPTPGVHPADKAVPALTDMPTLRQLRKLTNSTKKYPLRLLEKLAPRWEMLGDTLDFDSEGTHVQLIRKECAIEGPVACCRRVLMDWLKARGSFTYQPPTWAKLITILEDIDENRLVRELRTYLSE